MRTTSTIFTALFVYRLINAFTINTFFQPDEYFQSLEPAWQIAFGSESGAWITWEWRERLRSSIHPLLFAGAYRVANSIGNMIQADLQLRSSLLLGAPKVLQAIFAATADFYTIKLASRTYEHESTPIKAAILLTIASPWQWFCSVRTLSNSLETTLTVLGLCYWPWAWFSSQNDSKHSQPPSGELFMSLMTAAFACILRPTNIMIWATVALSSSIQSGDLRKAAILLQSVAGCGSAVLTLSVAVDQAYYGELVFPPLKFLYVNLVQSLAVFYGANRVDYYFTEGLPLLLTTFLPFAGLGLYQALRRRTSHKTQSKQQDIRYILALTILTTVFALTTISHKEVRFIYPLLPLLHVLAAQPLSQMYTSLSRTSSLAILTATLAINSTLALYLTRVHQSGVIAVLHHLRHAHEAKLAQDASAKTTVAFLMPCHSTPWRSHLIYPSLEAWALTCEPPLTIPLAERGAYMDEADEFYEDPARWLNEKMTVWPEKLVIFAQMENVLGEALVAKGYGRCWSGFNTHWHDDWRRVGDVVVYCANETEAEASLKVEGERIDKTTVA